MSACSCGGATCGCCAGVAVTVPADVANRPGLATLRTRIGTHGSFFASLQARLSSHRLADGTRPLAALRTRRRDDPALALLDAWAVAADVLTFYQQRIANEGYLRTATERLSLFGLARLVGYAPRPGVAASVYLSYTIDPAPAGAPPAATLIPAGARSQTVPAQDELPQSFETAADLDARAAWNRLGVRRTEPQQLATVTATGTLYLAGTQTRLRSGDPLLIGTGTPGGPVAGDPVPQAWRIVTVTEDGANARTRVALEPWMPPPPPAAQPATQTAEQVAPGPSLLAALAAPPSRPPADALGLRRDLGRSFAATGDAALQVVATATPRLAATLGAAVAADRGAAPPATLRVFAPRLRAGLFGSRALRRTASRLTPIMNGEFASGLFSNEVTDVGEWPIVTGSTLIDNQTKFAVTAHERPDQLWLDAAYDGLVPGWLLVDASAVPAAPVAAGKPQVMVTPAQPVQVVRAAAVQPKVSRSDYGMVADAAGLTLAAGERWLRLVDKPDDLKALLTQEVQNRDFQVLRNTAVYARSEELALAEAPTAGDVCGHGDPLELDALTLDLASGRFVVITGERADLPVPGVVASEAAMIAEVVHDVAADLPDGKGGVRRLPLRRAEELAPFDDKSAVQPRPLAGDTVHSFVTLERPLAYCYRRDTVRIDGNVVRATHGESRHEPLGGGDGTKALQAFTLRQAPVTWLAAPTVAGAASTVQLFVDDVQWHRIDSFLDAAPRDRVYLERSDSRGATTVVFGNGIAGARLPTGTGNVVAAYRSGIGRAGNARAGQISQLTTRPLGVRAVVNPLPATGGADAEGVGDIRRNAPLAVMAIDRLVATRDYADFARTFAGIGKASAVQLSDGRATVVHVSVAGSDDIPLDPGDDLLVNLRRAFADLGDPFQPVRVAVRELLLLIVAARIRVAPDHRWERVATDVRAALLAAFGFDRRELAQGAASSEVLAAIQGVAGVAWVDLDAFGAVPTLDDTGDTGVPRPPAAIAADVAAVVAAGVRPTVAAAPARGTGTLRPAQLLLLAPGVPATLVLNPID